MMAGDRGRLMVSSGEDAMKLSEPAARSSWAATMCASSSTNGARLGTPLQAAGVASLDVHGIAGSAQLAHPVAQIAMTVCIVDER